MSAPAGTRSLARNVEDADRRWFAGGGVHVWLAKAADTAGAFLLFEMTLDAGKATPLHTHPADEALVVLEGEILVHLDGSEHTDPNRRHRCRPGRRATRVPGQRWRGPRALSSHTWHL